VNLFISVRDQQTLEWIKNYFIPKLDHLVFLETDSHPSLFLDSQTSEVGSTWPAALGNALGASKVIVPGQG
jgi:hypothetical protein